LALKKQLFSPRLSVNYMTNIDRRESKERKRK